MKDKNTGKSRGFGYITMKDSLVIEKILRSQPIFIEGKQIDCRIAIPKDYINEVHNIMIHKSTNTNEKNIQCEGKQK